MNYNKIVRKQLREAVQKWIITKKSEKIIERSSTDQTDRKGEFDTKVVKDSKKEADDFMIYRR